MQSNLDTNFLGKLWRLKRLWITWQLQTHDLISVLSQFISVGMVFIWTEVSRSHYQAEANTCKP